MSISASIAQANNIGPPCTIFTEEQLTIPGSSLQQQRTSPNSNQERSTITYAVELGGSLYLIEQKLSIPCQVDYGNSWLNCISCGGGTFGTSQPWIHTKVSSISEQAILPNENSSIRSSTQA
ncbi:MAG: hypothetical protein ACYCQJ_00660 [Nitrososphaerales archaeon]